MKDQQTTLSLIARLRAILIKQRVVLFAAGIVTTAAVVLAVWIGLSLLANIIVLPVWIKIGLLVLAGLTALHFFYWRAVTRLFYGDVDGVAVNLEQKHPDLRGRLIAAVQFSRMKQSPGYSSELIEATERQALEQAGLIDFNEAVSYYPVLRTSRLLAGAAVLAVALLLLIPGFFSYSYEVYSNPTTEIAPPLAYQVVPIPGSTEWVKYRDIRIGAAVFGQRMPEKASIHHRLADGHWQKTDIKLAGLTRTAGEYGDSLEVSITLKQINKSFDYYVVAGRVKTEIQRVDVVDRPRVNGIHLSVFYPDYTGLSPTVVDENNGSFSAVVGSRATMKIATNLPIESAGMVFEDSSRTPMKVSGKSAEISLLVDKSRAYYIELYDRLGETNPDPIEYYITAVPDEYPSIDVLFPGYNVNLNDDMRLPLKVHMYDDYGFSSLVLKYTLVSQGRPSDESVAVIHYPERIKTEGEVEFNWDLSGFDIFPGDYVVYYFEVADNDVISGPKISKSRQYIARLPSLDELIAQTENENTQRVVDTESLIKSGKEQARRLKEAVRKLEAEGRRKNRDADWEQQKELESIADKNLELLDKVEKMAEEMDQSLEKMRDNTLMSREILEKMAEIQKLFEEIATPEMKEAQRKLMEALQKMDRDEIEKAMKDFKLSQEEMLDRLERTLALLKKMQVEQKMEAMIRRAEEIIERQDQVNQDAEQTEPEQLPQHSRTEDEIKKSLEGLKGELEQLQQLLKEAEMESSSEAKKFAEAVQKTDADQNMQNMSRSLSQKEKQESLDEGKQALSKLYEMLDEMQKQQMAMKGDDEDALKKAMRRAIDDANYLSNRQEELLQQAAQLDPQSMVMRDLAVSQQDLRGACNGLRNTISELGKASPFVAAELTQLLGNALNSIDEAMGEMDARRGNRAVAQQRQAMSELNRVSVRLMESLDRQNQCNNPKNCNKNMSKLESMCDKQNKLNQMTQKQCNNPKLSSEAKQNMRQALQRLAGEQGSIRKSLEELEREFGQSRQVLGRLDDIAREMKKVEEELSSGEVGQETTERQLKIFSRMLEASRSLQRKDYTDQRQAATAENDIFHVPPSLSSDILNDRGDLEDRLRQYLGSEYPPQYEEQIKAYFRALLQLQYQSRPQQEN